LQNSRKTQQNYPIEMIALFCCVNLLHNGGMKYGYARVSTDGQSIEAQVRQLAKAGAKRYSAKWRAVPRPNARSFAACSTSLRPMTW
jgi:Resolvase, N terminal domain